MQGISEKYTVLIVDDNPANLGMLTSYLKEYGYKTPIARNGDIALQRAKYIRPDIILLDVVMPGLDGFETCRRLKADEATRDIPIIFMTALNGTEDKLHGFEVGGVDYVTKPFQQEEVLARVATHVRIRELTKHLQKQTIKLEQANDEIQRLNEQLKAENLRVSADLKESEQKYQTLVEEISDGYFVIEDGVVVFANQVFCRMHGYELHEVPGKEFSQFVHPESRKEVADVYCKTRQAMSVSHLFEYLRLTKDARSLSTEMTAKTVKHENKLIDIGICRDITERVQMEHRMREAERMAYIGRITTSLSHEIRNPLSAVKMNLRILQNTRQFTETDWRHIDISVNEVMRLESILDELLDFAKPLRLQMSKCAINDTLESCVELLTVKFQQKGLVIVRSLASDLPMIYADPKKLSQAFINLLLNAFDASEDCSSIKVSSRYHSNENDPCIEVIVEDEGPGIAQKQIDKIFEPFFTTKSNGTGLGLTNTKQILDAHGGWIDVTTRSPHGASFHVYLPV